MTLGRKGLTSGVIKGLTMYCVEYYVLCAFLLSRTCCFVFLCTAEKYKAACL
ncbi:unnamed protein product, partial [Staurois parvus]